MPKAIEATAAPANIAKFNKSAIARIPLCLGSKSSIPLSGRTEAPEFVSKPLSAIVAEKPVALTLISIDQ
jgi:hypothetical protein